MFKIFKKYKMSCRIFFIYFFNTEGTTWLVHLFNNERSGEVTDNHRSQAVVGWKWSFNAAPFCHKQTAREMTGDGDSESPPPSPPYSFLSFWFVGWSGRYPTFTSIASTLHALSQNLTPSHSHFSAWKTLQYWLWRKFEEMHHAPIFKFFSFFVQKSDLTFHIGSSSLG